MNKDDNAPHAHTDDDRDTTATRHHHDVTNVTRDGVVPVA